MSLSYKANNNGTLLAVLVDMPELLALELLKYANLGIHVLAMWYVISQLRRGSITAWIWREAWICLSLAMCCMLIYRIADIWEEATYWRLILAAPNTFFLFLGFARLSRLLRTHLSKQVYHKDDHHD
jgi:hypothetical protein